MVGPLVLTVDGQYISARHIVKFFHQSVDRVEHLYVHTISNEVHKVINNSNPQKEANLFKNIGYFIANEATPPKQYPDLPYA